MIDLAEELKLGIIGNKIVNYECRENERFIQHIIYFDNGERLVIEHKRHEADFLLVDDTFKLMGEQE